MKPSTHRLLIGISLLLAMAIGGLSANAQSFAYVVNQSSNSVSVINTATNTVVATVPVGSNPFAVAIAPDGTMAYVTNNNDSTVSVINTATNTVVATVPVGGPPLGVAVTPNGAFAYVANTSANTVSVINTATNTVVATVSAGTDPNGVVITPSGAFAYVVNDQAVSVISTATNTVVATVPVPGGFGTDGPGVAMTPNGAFAYVSIGGGNISVVSTTTNTLTATVSTTGNTRGSNLYYVAFTPNGAFGYAAVAGFNEVAVFDTTNTVVATVPAGSFPVGVAITPNGGFAYVTNQNDNTVSVINTAANTVVATVPVGAKPFGVAITPSLDNDSAFSQLNGGNTLTGNQTINGNVNATAFAGNGAGLTGVAAANSLALGGVPASNYARLDIGNNLNGNQAVRGNITANAFLGDGSGLTNITSSTANFANAANFASTANNSLFLGGIAASNYARLDTNNAFTGSQNISGDLNITGNFSGAVGNFSGNVGLGVASPISKLSISSAGNDGIRLSGTSPAVFFHSGPEGTAGTQKGGLGLAQVPDNYGFGTQANDLNLFTQGGNINFNTATSLVNPNIRMTVTAGGNVGIGTATPHATLEVNGTTQFDNTVTFAPGQTFPGTATITGVTAGPGLFGGGSTGSVNLGVDQHVVAFQSDLSNGINTAESFATAAANAAQGNAISTAETYSSSTFLPLAGGNLTGGLVGTVATFSGTTTAGRVNAVDSYLLSGVPVLNANATYGGPPGGYLGGSVSVGIGAGPVGGLWNTYLGNGAGGQQPASNVVSNNTFVGKLAGGGATSGFNNSFFGANAGSGTTGTGNTFLGYAAGSGVTTGSSNTIIGSFAGAVYGPLTGSQNVYLGVSINPPPNESNTIRIGLNGSQSAAYLAGVYGGSTSSGVPVYVDANGRLGTGGGSGVGTITGVTAGPGLSGGGATGNVSLSIPAAGVTNAMLANPSLSVTAGAGLTGGGLVALGGTTTVSLTPNTCAVGSAVTAHPFSCSPFAGLGANTFTGNQTMPNLTVPGAILSGTGNFISAFSGSPTLSGSNNLGPGVFGISQGGVGVTGISANGPGVSGSSISGAAVLGRTQSTSAILAAGIFINDASGNAGNILLGESNGVTKFSVDSKGDVAASGNVTAAGSVTIGTGGTPILEHLSLAFTVSVPAVSPNNCSNLAPVTFTGASDGYTIALGVPNALVAGTSGDFLEYFGWVSATNQVTIRVCNPHGGSANNPVSGTIRVDIWKH